MVPESVLLCGVVKNVSVKIHKNIKGALLTGGFFQKFHIVLYENNSTDDTKI